MSRTARQFLADRATGVVPSHKPPLSRPPALGWTELAMMEEKQQTPEDRAEIARLERELQMREIGPICARTKGKK
jgi:hypothetical protein